MAKETALGLPMKNEQSESGFPSHDISVIIAYKAGGGTDIGARVLCSVAEKYLDVNLVINNISGGDGELGYAQLSNSKPDGYTIGFINLPTFVSLPLDRETLYSIDSIEPIMNHVFDSAVLVVPYENSCVTLEDFIENARDNPFSVTIGNNGYGASNHIAAAHFCKETNIQVTHVPFGGSSDMLKALNEGYVQSVVAKISEVAQGTRDNKYRILASFTEERIPSFPQVPTLKEKGIAFTFGSARALVAPKGTPPSIIATLLEAFKAAMFDLENVEESNRLDLPLLYMGPEELSGYIVEQRRYISDTVPTLPL
ncbi:tripartite tricarboxylate transporter substrate binding protein [Sphaerochaeta pleomorpha]|uniref:tripartite tricarboxylate transporter substrate binding protein n=1 Tax=Sphaerochaeta pleomorpha TaxID=1131707 RepID=UPI001C069786|nr:tripartite tricarboxylate transporter substrate binding protein [Sphaerochaeta pleomorpha]